MNKNMSDPPTVYDKKKTRRAMWLSPLLGFVGLLPFVFKLDLSPTAFAIVFAAIILVSYALGLVIGGMGYLLLKRFGSIESKWLMAYAAGWVLVTPILVGDPYAVLVFGPPTLLVAAAFCYLRGRAIPRVEAP